MPSNSAYLDAALGEFLNEVFQEGDSPATAGSAISALKRFLPKLRLKLPTAAQYYSNWIRVYRPNRAAPIPWKVVQAMAGGAFESGHSRLAICLLLQFLFFLRSSELFGLRPCDVGCFSSGHVVVALPATKTSRGRGQSIALFDPFLARHLSTHLRRFQPRRPLWPHSARYFRFAFHRLLEVLGYPEGSFQPYSLRRGGATFHWVRTRNFETTMIMGRWQNPRTCRIYLDEARALSLQHEADASSHPFIPALVRSCASRFASGHAC